MRNALLLFALLTASFSQAQLVAWKVRVGNGSNDIARTTWARDGKLLIALDTDDQMALARVDQATGHTDWVRKLGKGHIGGFNWTLYEPVIVYGNYVDAAGYSHARIVCLDPGTGAVKWVKGGMSGSDGMTSKVLTAFFSDGRLFEVGSEEGNAVALLRSVADGHVQKINYLPGSEVTSVCWGGSGPAFATVDHGKAWVGVLTPLNDTDFVMPLSYGPDPTARFENVRLGPSMSFDIPLVFSDLVQEGKGRHALMQAYRRYPPMLVYEELFTTRATTTWLDTRFGSALLRTVDGTGKVRTEVHSWLDDHSYILANVPWELPFNVSHYSTDGGMVGEAFLLNRGRDIVTYPGNNAYDLGGDESFVDFASGASGNLLMLANSTKNGASQAMLMNIQVPKFKLVPTEDDGLPGKAISLASPAPVGGYDIKVAAPEGAPVTISSPVHIAAGSVFGRARIIPKHVDYRTPVSLTLSAQGRTWTEMITIAPPWSATIQPAAESVTSGESISVTVTLNNLAPEGGQKVTLTRSNAALEMPKEVTVPEGRLTVRFLATAKAVTEDKDVTVSAWFFGKANTAHIIVKKSN